MPQASGDYRIYVENKVGVVADYEVTEAALAGALRERGLSASISIHPSHSPDLAALGDASFFVGSGFDTNMIRSHGRHIRLVHCTSAGVERYLPLDWLPDGAVFTNSSGVHAEKGGAFGAMAVLMLNEHMPRHATNQKRHVWDGRLTETITGKNVLIYGFGSLGEAVAERLKAFGVRIAGVRRSGESHVGADRILTPDRFKDALSSVHFLVLTCPLTLETRGVVGRDELALLPKGAAVLNMARAAVLDNAALGDALRSGHLSGAILDVFDPEPLPADSELWDVPNLLISPHVSCDAAEGYITRCLSIFADNLKRFVSGHALLNVVNGARGY